MVDGGVSPLFLMEKERRFINEARCVFSYFPF